MKPLYENPLCTRYASKEMQAIFSPDYKFGTWRKLWLALAEAEKTLGLDITEEQLKELAAHLDDIDYDKAAEYEKRFRHDVMAHVHTFGDAAPAAKSIIHLGATSSFVDDNTDILQMRDALLRIKKLLVNAIKGVSEFCMKYKDVPTLGFTHYQSAQPTTVGKRATLWLSELIADYERLEFELSGLKFFGCKGTTGTGASFYELFDGDSDKIYKLEELIAEKFGFDKIIAVSGQTYSRKIDSFVLGVLSGIAQSATKFAGDVRLLSHDKEVDEPFESGQIGSSAMAYKRNPMRSERITSLARYVICASLNPQFTAATQWLERSLDDSANKRITIAEAFLATDAILTIYINVIEGMKVNQKMIEKHLDTELPFMATENILMYCVKHKGQDRQALHEAIRELSVDVASKVKAGADNDLLERIAKDARFNLSAEELGKIVKAENFVGIAPLQTEKFVLSTAKPILEKNTTLLGVEAIINI